MSKTKKKEEERKQRREEMAKKYPMQNPRTTVSAVLTKKGDMTGVQKIGVAKPGEENNTVTLLNRISPNLKPQVENYPLRLNEYEPKKQTWQSDTDRSAQTEAVRKAIEDREYRNRAATGWQRYQIDEANKRLARADPAYKRWKEQFGEDEVDEALYKPAKNWPDRANNSFGYIYSQNKEDAFEFARVLNIAYKELDEIVAHQRTGGLEANRAAAGLETANTAADWLKGLGLDDKLKTAWERHGEAQSSYGAAMKQQSDNTVNAAKWLWDQHKTNASTLVNAQAEQAKAQPQGLREVAEKSWGYVESNIGKINDATQSNQMGAGVYGFLQSAAPDEQNEIESIDAQRKALAESVTDNAWSMLGGFVGARAASVLQPLDLVKSVWEGGSAGHVDLSGGEFYQIKDTIDDAISQELGEAFPRIDEDVPFIGGMGMDDLYDIIAGEADSGISLKLPGGVVHKGVSAISESFHTALEEAKRGGTENKTAIKYATFKSIGTGISEILDAAEIKNLDIMKPDDVIGKIISKGLKSGAIEIIDDGASDILQKLFPSYEGGLRSQPTESEETANDWRNGFWGGVLSGSTPEVINATKDIAKEIIKKIQAQK